MSRSFQKQYGLILLIGPVTISVGLRREPDERLKAYAEKDRFFQIGLAAQVEAGRLSVQAGVKWDR